MLYDSLKIIGFYKNDDNLMIILMNPKLLDQLKVGLSLMGWLPNNGGPLIMGDTLMMGQPIIGGPQINGLPNNRRPNKRWGY